MGKVTSLIAFLFVLSVTASFAQQKDEQKATAKASVSYGIIVDNSGSARSSLEKIITAAKEIINENAEGDETFLVRFTSSDKIRLVEEFTNDKEKLREAAADLFIEPGLTAIIDAIEFSAKYLNENANSRAERKKILILITDGEERQSKAKLEDVLKSLKENGVKVFSIGISDEKVSRKVLNKLADETGGKLFVPKNQVELTAMTKEIVSIIRVQ